MKWQLWIAGLLIGSTSLWLGCEVKRTADLPPTGQKSHDGHDHDGHDHDGHDHEGHDDEGHDHPEHGPNGGHVAHFDTSPTTHFEWAHDDDNHTLTVYFEDLISGGATIESVQVLVTSADSEKKFSLEPDPKAKMAGSIFQAKDQELLTLVGASGSDPKGVQAKLKVVIDGKEESVLLKDDHHHH
jgi:hypothetical protein